MTTLVYRAEMFRGDPSTRTNYAGAVDGLPVVGVGRSREEAIRNTEDAMRIHLGQLLYLDQRFPKSFRGAIANDDHFAIQIESDSIQPYNHFPEERPRKP